MTILDGVIDGVELSGKTTQIYAAGTLERSSRSTSYTGTYNELTNIITNGGVLNVSGGEVKNAVINSGGIVNVYGGTLTGAVMGSNADELYTGYRTASATKGSKTDSEPVESNTVAAELNVYGGIVNALVVSGGIVNIDGGTMMEASIVISEKPPISLLIPFLKEKLTIKADK